MTTRATVSALLVRRVLSAAAFMGADPQELAAAAQIPLEARADVNARLPQEIALALWEQAERATGIGNFGIACAELSRRAPANALMFAIATSPSTRRALDCISRYVRLIHDGVELRVEVEGELARVRLAFPPGVPSHRHGVEFTMAQVALVCREHLGPGFTLHEVSFTHPRPANISEHERVFGRTPRFARPHSEMLFDRAFLDQPFSHHDPALHAQLGRHLDQLVLELDAEHTLRARVQKLVTEELRRGVPDIDEIAHKLGLGGRTLQRKLQDEGTSFQEVVSEARRETALRYLGDSALSLSEVAFLLGYTEPSNFHRAFKRWTGTTPAEARRRALAR